jgi:Ethylbenzene dehydrogenase
VLAIHAVSALVLIAIAVAYVVFLTRTRLFGRIALRGVVYRLRRRKTRCCGVNRLLYWVSFTLLGGAFLTGSAMYFDEPVNGDLVQKAHYLFAAGFLLYLPAHVIAQSLQGGLAHLLRMFRPRWLYSSALLVAIIAGVGVAASLYGFTRAAMPALLVGRVDSKELMQGYPSDRAWMNAEAITIRTTHGRHFPNGVADVSVRALRDQDRAYFLFEWPDTTRSLMYLPLSKTPNGWKKMQTKFPVSDEDEFMDDKFAVLLSNSPALGVGNAVHLGPKPIADRPGSANKRGLHYTVDGSIVDVWYWRSDRHTYTRQLEDMYFGPPLEPKPGKRYTGGWTGDPSCTGGAGPNYSEIEGSDYVVPKRLPKEPALLQVKSGESMADPGVTDTGKWWLTQDDSVAYSNDLDTYPIGTLLPSVLINGPYQGDCGDVFAVGTWTNGHWRLAVSRKLDTGSQYDVVIKDGIYLWVAAFDRTQARHSRHQQPVKITFAE